MITVADHVMPWLMPRRTFAATIQPDQPSGHEDRLAANPIGERASRQVGQCLGCTEGDDERGCRAECGDAKGALGEQRQDRAFLADHAAHERVHRDEKAELREVLS